jgi:hypothetical protein
MKDRGSLGRIALFSGVILSLSGAAAWARRAPDASPIDEEDLSVDPATGSVLLDLDDAASDDEWARARDAIARGVAPYELVVDDSPRDELGALLSDDAELYRLDVPASEVSDVLHELAADADVEVAEVERSWSLPEGEAFSASDLAAAGSLSDATSEDPSSADRRASPPTIRTTDTSGTSTSSGCPARGSARVATASSSP